MNTWAALVQSGSLFYRVCFGFFCFFTFIFGQTLIFGHFLSSQRATFKLLCPSQLQSRHTKRWQSGTVFFLDIGVDESGVRLYFSRCLLRISQFFIFHLRHLWLTSFLCKWALWPSGWRPQVSYVKPVRLCGDKSIPLTSRTGRRHRPTLC